MAQEKTKIYDRMTSGLAAAAGWTLKIVGGCIFVWLSWYAMRYTQYIPPYGDEFPANVPDSVARNLLALAIAAGGIGLLFLLEKRLAPKAQEWVMRAAVTALSLWMGGAGLYWIREIDRVPVGDQAFIYGGASYFIEGGYFFLEKGGYCDMWPQQLGLMAVVEALFRLVGTYNYFACQLINVALVVGIGILGYLLIRRMTGHMAVVLGYCLCMVFCLPLIFYTGWVYGDVPSIFCILLSAVLLLQYGKDGRIRYLAALVPAVTMAVLVRENSLIMLIALCLCAGVYALQRKDKKLLAALVLCVALPWAAYTGVTKMYETRAGLAHPLGGIPATSYLAMGMQEENGKYGWFTEYCKKVYWESDNDPEYARWVSGIHIKERLAYFRDNPAYARAFYREKLLSQWNQPLYQSLFFSAQYSEGKEPGPDSLDYKVHGQYFVQVLACCDRMQFVLYAGMVCYFLFAVKKGDSILKYLLAATILGGFFFSVIWEAKARYILPYYVMMYPLAVVGYWQLMRGVMRLFGRREKKEQQDNVIPFRKVA